MMCTTKPPKVDLRLHPVETALKTAHSLVGHNQQMHIKSS